MKSTQTPWWAQRPGTQVHPAGAFSRGRLRRVAIRVLIVGAVTGGLFATAVGTSQPRTRDEGLGLTSIRQSTDSLHGGCGRVFERRTTADAVGVIASVKADGVTANVPSYRTIVPMAGPFWSPPAEPGIRMYARDSPTIPRPARLLHNMWSGALVVYYTSAAHPADVRALTLIAATRDDLDIIVVPWDTTRGPLPSGRKIAFATWGASQTCQRLVVPALDQFRIAYPQDQAPGYGGAIAPTLTATRPSAQ